ncbi:hypothetical protein ACFPRL_23435 [Pseudoclavibacter helvolus]
MRRLVPEVAKIRLARIPDGKRRFGDRRANRVLVDAPFHHDLRHVERVRGGILMRKRVRPIQRLDATVVHDHLASQTSAPGPMHDPGVT